MTADRPVKLPELPHAYGAELERLFVLMRAWSEAPHGSAASDAAEPIAAHVGKMMSDFGNAAVLLERAEADKVLRLAVEALKAMNQCLCNSASYEQWNAANESACAALAAIRTHLGALT